MALSLTFQPSGNTIIYARSPIFYKFEGCDASQYTYLISLSATTGATASLAEYVTINRTPDLNNYIIIDVGNIVKNYIRSTFSVSTENATYVQIACIEYDGTSVNSTITSNICVATYGYSNYLDGFNHTNNSDSYKMSSIPNTIYLPNYGSSGNTYSISFCNNENCDYHINYFSLTSGYTSTASQSFPTVGDAKTNIIAIPCGYSDINSDVDVNKYMELVITGGTIKNIRINPDNCNGNDLHNLKFINKFGTWDKIFIKAKTEESTTTKSETYKYNKVNRTTMTYQTDGSYHKLFTNGKTTIRLNTGWISEDMNTVLDELMLSEQVYYDNKPCIITDNNISYKTQKYDKLINYIITIELSYDKINNVI